jgi:telomerase reverse transcriptase
MRMVDDFLFVTTSQADAKRFLRLMEGGFPEYGCRIAVDKALTNFPTLPVDTKGTIVASHGTRMPFPWCGLLISQQDLSTTVDYTRYIGQPLRDALSVDITKRPGTNFIYKMVQAVQARAHAIYNDAKLNNPRVICLNVYQNYLLTALKVR